VALKEDVAVVTKRLWLWSAWVALGGVLGAFFSLRSRHEGVDPFVLVVALALGFLAGWAATYLLWSLLVRRMAS